MKMTEIPSYMIKNPEFEAYKPKKKRYSYSSSIFSMLLSIFSYILIFHVFQVSPSSIFKDTKVLFFVSNAIILIIAVDYGSFTSKESQDFYGEYNAAMARRSSPVNYYPSPVMPYQENPRAVEIKKLEEEEIKKPNEEEEPMVKEMVCVSHPEKIVQVVTEEKPREDVAMEIYKPVVNDQVVASEETCDTRKHVMMNHKQYGRTKSVKSRGVKKTRKDREIKRKSYTRSESVCSKWMVVSEKWENVEEESEEFSKMSNEELNKTFEDFIQRFNRQIRQQSRV